MLTLNGANKLIGLNIEDTSDKIFLWVTRASIFFFVPWQTWRPSSVTVHCIPSTEDSSVLGSISTCFVSLIDFNSTGIASETLSLLPIYFFVQIPSEKEDVATDHRLQRFLQGFLLIWWNRPCRSCFILLLLQLDTFFGYRVPLVWEHKLRKLKTEILAPNTWRWYSCFWTGFIVLGCHGKLLSCSGTSNCSKIDIRYLLLGLLVFHENWKSFQSNHVAVQVLLLAYHLGILLCTLTQHCKQISLCQACSGLALDGKAKTNFSRRCSLLRIRPISLRIPSLRLYLLSVDTNF